MRWQQRRKWRDKTYTSRSCLTTSITKGRGLIVSRFPLGICKTRLIELGTATTILDPLSTLRVGQSSGISFGAATSVCSKSLGSKATGAKTTSCRVVVKMTKPEAMENEVVFLDIVRDSSSDFDSYSLPDFARPMYSTCASVSGTVAGITIL